MRTGTSSWSWERLLWQKGGSVPIVVQRRMFLLGSESFKKPRLEVSPTPIRMCDQILPSAKSAMMFPD
jgi:hypothetical protein